MLNISIYQINQDKDEDAVAFLSFDMLEKFQGTTEINSEIYQQVFAGNVPCENLEDVYRMFNVDKPEGYGGRSLSVSDIVGIAGDNGKITYHYCDSIGFREVAFDASLAGRLRPMKMKGLSVFSG